MTADKPSNEQIAKEARFALAELDRLEKVSTAGFEPEAAPQITEEIRFEIAMFRPLRDMMTSLAAGTFDVAEHGYALASMVCQGAGHKARHLEGQGELPYVEWVDVTAAAVELKTPGDVADDGNVFEDDEFGISLFPDGTVILHGDREQLAATLREALVLLENG